MQIKLAFVFGISAICPLVVIRVYLICVQYQLFNYAGEQQRSDAQLAKNILDLCLMGKDAEVGRRER